MNAVDARCDVISGLLGRWHAGTLRAADRDAFEQHLLFCPPCLAQHDKARLAVAALVRAPGTAAPVALVERLVARVDRSGGG